MDAISSNQGFKKRILIIWALSLAVMHIAFTVLSVWHCYISGDIMKVTADKILTYVIPILAFIVIYFRFAVMVSAYHSYREGTLPFTIIAVVSLVITGISYLIVKRFSSPDFARILENELIGTLMSFMIDLAVVILIFLFSRSKKEQKRTVTRLIIITCLFPLVISLIEEIWFLGVFLMEIKEESGSMAVTSSELGAIVKAFAVPFIEAILGFLLMLGTHKILKHSSR